MAAKLCHITLGPNGYDERFQIVDRNGVKVDLPVSSVKIELNARSETTAVVTLCGVVVDAYVQGLTLRPEPRGDEDMD